MPFLKKKTEMPIIWIILIKFSPLQIFVNVKSDDNHMMLLINADTNYDGANGRTPQKGMNTGVWIELFVVIHYCKRSCHLWHVYDLWRFYPKNLAQFIIRTLNLIDFYIPVILLISDSNIGHS